MPKTPSFEVWKLLKNPQSLGQSDTKTINLEDAKSYLEEIMDSFSSF